MITQQQFLAGGAFTYDGHMRALATRSPMEYDQEARILTDGNGEDIGPVSIISERGFVADMGPKYGKVTVFYNECNLTN